MPLQIGHRKHQVAFGRAERGGCIEDGAMTAVRSSLLAVGGLLALTLVAAPAQAHVAAPPATTGPSSDMGVAFVGVWTCADPVDGGECN